MKYNHPVFGQKFIYSDSHVVVEWILEDHGGGIYAVEIGEQNKKYVYTLYEKYYNDQFSCELMHNIYKLLRQEKSEKEINLLILENA